MRPITIVVWSEKKLVRQILHAYTSLQYSGNELVVTGLWEQCGKTNYLYRVRYGTEVVCEIRWYKKNAYTYKRFPFYATVEIKDIRLTTISEEAFLEQWAKAMNWKWFYLRAVDKALEGVTQ